MHCLAVGKTEKRSTRLGFRAVTFRGQFHFPLLSLNAAATEHRDVAPTGGRFSYFLRLEVTSAKGQSDEFEVK